MAVNLWKASTSNAFSTTLNGSIAAGDTSITLTSVTGLQFPGILCIDRVDSNNNNTPTSREYISYTGISSFTLTGVTRGVGGSTAQSHSSGAIVEENFSVTHWGDMLDFLKASHDANGNVVVSSTATISVLRLYTALQASGASVVLSDITIPNSINVSGASIVGNFPIHPVWVIGGSVSLATTSVGKPLPMPQPGRWSFFSAVLRTPASGASLLLDINKNGTSIFTDQNTRLLISGAATFISTASIGTLSYSSGDIFTVDIDAGAGLGQDLTIIGRGS